MADDCGLLKFTYRQRDCESCAGRNVETLWSQAFKARTRSGFWNFQTTDVICKDCGFVFVSPAQKSEELLEYYSDSLSPYASQELDYDVDKRLKAIDRVLSRGGVYKRFLELGSNAQSFFHDALKLRFTDILLYEPNGDHTSNVSDVHAIESGSVDVVAAYFVLEHVIEVRQFLVDAFKKLRPGGALILEVPNLLHYPNDTNALALYEHVNHFDIASLSRIAASVGFRLVESSTEDCSRSFGFVAIFERTTLAEAGAVDSNNYQRNKAAFLAGLERYEAIEKHANALRGQLDLNGPDRQRFIFWGANDNLIRFLGDSDFDINPVIVDSNPDKKEYFSRRLDVFTPKEVSGEIIEADAIVIFTNRHAQQILDTIRSDFGKEFADNNVHILDFQS